jgi:hypothetical protein
MPAAGAAGIEGGASGARIGDPTVTRSQGALPAWTWSRRRRSCVGAVPPPRPARRLGGVARQHDDDALDVLGERRADTAACTADCTRRGEPSPAPASTTRGR